MSNMLGTIALAAMLMCVGQAIHAADCEHVVFARRVYELYHEGRHAEYGAMIVERFRNRAADLFSMAQEEKDYPRQAFFDGTGTERNSYQIPSIPRVEDAAQSTQDPYYVREQVVVYCQILLELAELPVHAPVGRMISDHDMMKTSGWFDLQFRDNLMSRLTDRFRGGHLTPFEQSYVAPRLLIAWATWWARLVEVCEMLPPAPELQYHQDGLNHHPIATPELA